MASDGRAFLAMSVLAVHAIVILFNVGGLVVIPVGAWRRWRWVRRRGWRLVHVLSLAVVAFQALLGQACFLTLWQSALSGHNGQPTPLVMQWVDRLIYWPLPGWFFAVLYVLVWFYVLLLWRWVPPSPGK